MSATLVESDWYFGDGVADLVRAVSIDYAAMERATGSTVAYWTAGMTTDEGRAWLWRACRVYQLTRLRPPVQAHYEAARFVFRLKAVDAHANLGVAPHDLRNVGLVA